MKNSQHEVVVESLANSGDGVGRINQKVVFIPFSCPGDKLLIKIIEDKKTFYKAKILEVIEPSKDRQSPKCPHFGSCGGCDWQHIKYESQIFWKRKNLVDVLTRIGEVHDEDRIAPLQKAHTTFSYRNRIQVHTDSTGPYYLQKGSKNPIHIKNCPLATERINSWINKNLDQLKKKKSKIEIADNDQGIELYNVNSKGQSELGFRQVNTEQNNFLIQSILDFIQANKVHKVVDLFCGQGNWSLSIATNNSEIDCLGVDINKTNIEIALRNAQPNNQFLLGDVFELKDQWAHQSDLIIVDPPRKGCSPEIIEILNKLTNPWLIYISCHPATLARDLRMLLDGPWSLSKVVPVDMFPQTAHLECLCILHSTNGAKTANY